MVLGAYRRAWQGGQTATEIASQYTVWCWVLIDTPVRVTAKSGKLKSQYTVWCWVLIDSVVFHRLSRVPRSQYTVWCWVLIDRRSFLPSCWRSCLNTPCGAGCLSTGEVGKLRTWADGLNTPCGAGCLSTVT